ASGPCTWPSSIRDKISAQTQPGDLAHVVMLRWKAPGDGTAASAVRYNALQGRFGQAANGAPAPLESFTILSTRCHPSPSITPLASLPTLLSTQYPIAPEAATRGSLEQGIDATSAGRLNPYWLGVGGSTNHVDHELGVRQHRDVATLDLTNRGA